MPDTSRAEEMFAELRELARTDPVGLTTRIEGWVTERRMEDEYLEFKASAHSFEDPNVRDKDGKDAENWSKAIASFANTSGGLVVWGIYAAAEKRPDGKPVDAAARLQPLRSTEHHVQFLKNKLRDSTNEPIPGIEHLQVPASIGGGGYVVSLVPEGPNKPYRAMRLLHQPYVFRIGDTTEVIPHAILRTMFFPRQQSNFQFFGNFVRGQNESEVRLQIEVQNEGTATARELSIVIDIHPPVESVQPAHGFECNSEKGSPGGTRNRLPIGTPIHPGERRIACIVRIGTRQPNQLRILEFVDLHIAAYMRDQEPQYFEHKVTKDDCFFPLEFEIEKTGKRMTTVVVVA